MSANRVIPHVIQTNDYYDSESKSDNTLAVSVISLNLIFFFLSFPIAIYDIVAQNVTSNDLVSYTIQVLYYSNYSIGFYAHTVVNKEFRNEFLKLLNLKVANVKQSTSNTTLNERMQSK